MIIESNALAEPDRTSAVSDSDWDVVILPKRHLLDINFAELWHYRDLIWMFVKRDLVTVYKQTILGPVWYLIQPIATTVVFLFVFKKIAQLSTDGVPAPVFYLSGIVIWNYFAESLAKTANTFLGNASIFGKVYFPRLAVPLSMVISGFVKFLIQFGLFSLVYAYYWGFRETNLQPNVWLLVSIYCILLMASLGLAIGIVVTSLTTKYRDLTFLIGFGVQLLMYATPVIYPMSVVSQSVRDLLWYNPITHIIESFRFGFLGVGEASIAGLAYTTAFTGAALFLGILIFNRTEQTFMDTV